MDVIVLFIKTSPLPHHHHGGYAAWLHHGQNSSDPTRGLFPVVEVECVRDFRNLLIG